MKAVYYPTPGLFDLSKLFEMKLILSRKGFDSQAGGRPSPIFPNGTLYSLPIPHHQSEITYGDLSHSNTNIGEVVEDLTGKHVKRDHYAHLDPDINCIAYPRREDWRPLFGQSGAAQGHLDNQNVQIGDLFLFFGLFRNVEKTSSKWGFVKDAPKQHVLWGWFQIGEIRKVDELSKNELPWAHYHPHRHPSRGKDPTNTLYIASYGLHLGDRSIAPGAGQFPKFHEHLVLTNPNGSRVTDWRLPRCFYPDKGKCSLTYHPKLDRWRHDDRYAYLQSASRGQEFVLDLDQYPDVINWLMESIFNL